MDMKISKKHLDVAMLPVFCCNRNIGISLAACAAVLLLEEDAPYISSTKGKTRAVRFVGW